jgi:hypothetical protein
MQQLTIDNYKYQEIPQEEVYSRYEIPDSPVPIAGIDLDRTYYVWDEHYYPIPTPTSVPTAVSVTLAQTSGTATATSATEHGYIPGQIVTIAGANQSGYNGAMEILTVPTTLTFTFTVDSGTVSPGTGTITACERNIEIWYWEYPSYPSSTTSSIIVPDEYLDLLVAYAEGRYWSTAHKRSKSSDAFLEFETRLNDMRRENTRKKFYAI